MHASWYIYGDMLGIPVDGMFYSSLSFDFLTNPFDGCRSCTSQQNVAFEAYFHSFFFLFVQSRGNLNFVMDNKIWMKKHVQTCH